MAIVTYALTLAQHSEKGDAYSRLRLMKIQSDDFIYWSNNKITVSNTTVADTRREYRPRREGPYDGYATQASGYALATYLLNNDREAGYPIMRFLVFMRNSIGGQASTQDSIVALRALTDFARTSNTRNLYNLQFTTTATSTSDWKNEMILNIQDFDIMQNVNVPNVWGFVRVEAKGTGLATLSLDTTVNVEYSKYLRQPYDNFFNLTLKEIYFTGRNYSVMRMQPCAKWLKEGVSGAAVIEVEIPNGFHVLNGALRKYAKSGQVPNLRDGWFTRPYIRFFFDNLTNVDTCVEFIAHRWWPVANVTREHIAKVYDFYEPGRFHQVVYTTFQLFYLSVCHVCGSFQCPYCPDCNGSGAYSPHLSLTLMVACLLLAVWRNFKTRSLVDDNDEL